MICLGIGLRMDESALQLSLPASKPGSNAASRGKKAGCIGSISSAVESQNLDVESMVAQHKSTLSQHQSCITVVSSPTELPILPPTAVELMSACTRVFNTIELLTAILKFCPLQILLCDGPRVCRTWKFTIDYNKTIQHHLFFKPWGEDDYFYRYAELNPYLARLCYIGDEHASPGCAMDWGPGPEGDSDDEDWDGGEYREDDNAMIKAELHWRKIEKDSRFMRETASWRRMLPMQPPSREIWNYHREEGDFLESKSSRYSDPNGKGYPTKLGEIYNDILSLEADKCCVRTRTWIRTSERWKVALQINVQVKPIDCEQDLLDNERSMYF